MPPLDVLDRPAARPATGAARAEELEAFYAGAPALEIMRLAIREEVAGRAALVSSFGADSAVLLHMAAAIDPATPVIFLDTAKHFAETLAYRDRLVADLGLVDVRSLAPHLQHLAARDPAGRLHTTDPDLCCHLRKTEPLGPALAGFDAWITGRRRTQAITRAGLCTFEWDGTHIKINPLATWTPALIEGYRRRHALPVHPLAAQGYLSIGCAPCTSRVLPGEPARAGRWRGVPKTECGIHAANGKVIRMSAEASLDGAPDADGPLWKAGAFRRDLWLRAPESDALPDAPAIVSKARWLGERDKLAARNAPLGLLLEAGAGLDDLAADLPRFSLIALEFPKFSDGRAFSTARLLREKHGFTGELRAVGNVLSDQIPFMRRVGFDAFEVTHGPTRRALAEGRIAEVHLHYQPAGADEPPTGTRPWLRRRSART